MKEKIERLPTVSSVANRGLAFFLDTAKRALGWRSRERGGAYFNDISTPAKEKARSPTDERCLANCVPAPAARLPSRPASFEGLPLG